MFKNKILVVEDSQLTLKIIKEYLIEYGYAVESCSKGKEAIIKACGDFPPDLILMDIELDGNMDGIETAHYILKDKEIPIIFLTANASKEILERVKNINSYGFILKGTDKYALLSSMEQAIKLAAKTVEAKLYQDIYEYSLDELYIFSPETLKFISANYAARKKLGYTIEELREMTPIDIKPEFDLKTFKELIAPIINGEKKEISFETMHRRKDGSFYPIEVRLKLHKYQDEELIIVVTVDLTERKKLEEENRQKEERIRLMMEGIPSPAWLIAKDRRVLAQNKTAERIFKKKVGEYCWEGIKCKEKLDEKYWETYKKTNTPLPETKCFFCLADKALEKKEPVNSEVEFVGAIWDTWWIPLGDDIYLHYASDVTKYKKMENELRLLSITDALTNIYNRRYFTQKLEEEIERTKRTNSIFSIIMLDIDHFKKVNDRFGHNMGDLVLKSMVEMIKNRIRKIDIFARWGGEEFIILLPDTPVDNAVILAEELRRKLSKMDITGVGSVTASFGVARYCPSDTIDTLVKKVDNLMYDAKASGRNCVKYTKECE